MMDYDLVLAIVAHELAHIAKGHVSPVNEEERDRQEKEAWILVHKWGFVDEVKKYMAADIRRSKFYESLITESGKK